MGVILSISSIKNLWGCIEKRITHKYWLTLKKTDNSKRKIPSKCRIGEACFTYIAIIGGKLFITYPKNMNHVHKYTKYLFSVTISMGTNMS